MDAGKLVIALITIAGSMGFTGCWGDAARSAEAPKAQDRANAANVSLGHRDRDATTKHARPLHKSTAAVAFLATYHNPEEGISFAYPRNYSLEEGDLEEHSFFLKRQEELDSEQPGARLVATVLIPEDGYPNTTFVHGSLQLVVNESASETSCRVLGTGDGVNHAPARKIEGVARWSSEQESVVGGVKLTERTYTGYSRGTCYQFLIRVAAEDAPDPDGFQRAADTGKILRQLEKIISSVEVFDKSGAPPEERSEEVNSACDHNH
jgi:hypothetical protein